MHDIHGIFGILCSLLATFFSFFKAFSYVNEGELGIKLRFGKARKDKSGKPKIIHPGFVLMIPWVDTLMKHHVRQQTLRFDNQRIMIKDGFILNINAVLIFRVTDIYRALFEIDDLHNSLAGISMGVLRDVFTGRDHKNLSDTKEISNLLLDGLGEKVQQWGVELLQFNIIDCAPTSETAQIILAQTGVLMKAEALNSMAEKFKIPITQLNSTLAAVLVGVPLVASTSADQNLATEYTDLSPQEPETEKSSFSFSVSK